MTEPRIVDAVEAARPDYWIGVSVSHGTAHLWSNIPRKSSDELMEDVKHFGVSPQFIVRLPGTTAPAPATATDAVAVAEIERAMHQLDAARRFIFQESDHNCVTCIDAARDRLVDALAKIRGAK